MTGIYKIISPSGSIYIGQTRNIKIRFTNYKSCNKKQVHIYNSIQKYGYNTHKFEIVHELPNDVEQSILDDYEILYWEMYKDCRFNLMNIREPGKGGRNSEETRRKMSQAKKGIKHSEEHKTKIGLTQKGRIFSEEHRRKLSLAKLKR